MESDAKKAIREVERLKEILNPILKEIRAEAKKEFEMHPDKADIITAAIIIEELILRVEKGGLCYGFKILKSLIGRYHERIEGISFIEPTIN